MVPITYHLKRLWPLLFDWQAVKAMTTWPKFSIASYQIVSALYKQGIQPKTLIDVGANTGQFTIAALNFFKGLCVHAFEPIEACVNQFNLNTCGYGHVHIHHLALGAEPKRAAFHINHYHQSSSLLKMSKKHHREFSSSKEKKTIMIDVSPLDHLFCNTMFTSPVLLKIDAQGAEKQVLKGGKETLKKVDYTLLEASFSPMYDGEPLFLELIETMKTFDFDFLRPVDFLKSPKTGEMLQADLLFKNTNIKSVDP